MCDGTGNYKVYVFERGIVARYLSKGSAKTILSMWEYQGFKGVIREEK